MRPIIIPIILALIIIVPLNSTNRGFSLATANGQVTKMDTLARATPKGSQISGEAQLVTFYEDGKETSEEYLSSFDRIREDAIQKQIHDKAFTLLGITSDEELSDSINHAKYMNEFKKLVNFKILDEPRLVFKDSRKKIVRTLPLKNIYKQFKYEDKNGYLWPMCRTTNKGYVLSENRKWALCTQYVSDHLNETPEVTARFERLRSAQPENYNFISLWHRAIHGDIKLLDSLGNTVWGKPIYTILGMQHNLPVSHVSNNGDCFMVMVADPTVLEHENTEHDADKVILGLDKKGEQIFLLSDKNQAKVGGMIISPNGRFLATQSWGGVSTTFYSVTGMKRWSTSDELVIRNISDIGIVDYFIGGRPEQRFSIDLRTHLTE